MSFALLGTWGGLYAYTPELYPTGLRATGMGVAGAMARVGGLLAPSAIALDHRRLLRARDRPVRGAAAARGARGQPDRPRDQGPAAGSSRSRHDLSHPPQEMPDIRSGRVVLSPPPPAPPTAAATGRRRGRCGRGVARGCRAETMRPRLRTRISSASTMVARRWRRRGVVTMWPRLHRAAWTACSVALSSARNRGLVQDHDARALEDGAGERDALLLAAGQLEAALADHRVVAGAGRR